MRTSHLLERIERAVSLSPTVAEAFRQVDRACFVPQYYRHQGAEWVLEAPGNLVYKDQALVTQVCNGLASSSSTQPSIMALMLEALDVEPGQQVLEVGTGTGYNTALLAHLVGPYGHVVSVEIDGALLAAAQRRIEQAGYAERVSLVHADGRQPVSEEATCDRLILTAGSRVLEPAWRVQLRPNGVLVGSLQGRLFRVLFRLQQEAPGRLCGHLLSHSAFFMELHGETFPVMHAPVWEAYDAVSRQCLQADPELLNALEQQAFLFFLEGQLPQAQFHLRAFGTPEQPELCQVLLAEQSCAIVHRNGLVEVQGSIWEDITQAYERYQHLGAPTLGEYHLEVTEQQHLLARFGAAVWRVL